MPNQHNHLIQTSTPFARPKRGQTALVAALATVLTACSAGPDGVSEDAGSPLEPDASQAGVSSEPGGDASVAAEQTVLAELPVLDGTVRFLRLVEPKGSLRFMVSETYPVATSQSVVADLYRQQLTMLEVFQTLAPERQAPKLLVDNHAYEAMALGRANDIVLRTHLDLEDYVLIPKQFSNTCSNFVFSCDEVASGHSLPPDGGCGNFRSSDPLSSSQVFLSAGSTSGSGNDWSYRIPPSRHATVGVCNGATTPIQAWAYWDIDDDSTGWVHTGDEPLAPGFGRRWYDFGAGFNGFPQSPMRVAASGSGQGNLAQMHLRVNEVVHLLGF